MQRIANEMTARVQHRTWDEFVAEARARGIYGILERYCETLGISLEYVFSEQRTKSVAYARDQLFLYLTDHYRWSGKEIGNLFGREHSTITYAVQRARAQARTP